MTTHHLDDTQPHAFWDNSYPARLRIQPGDTVVFETLEASAGQVGSDSVSEVVRNLNFDLIHPLTGPVYVEGAEPGDALAGNIDIRHLTPGSRAFFPVLVPGALFSCGDCHSAQGDGEVNGTGIETKMSVTLTFNLQKSAHIPELRFITPPGKKLTVADEGGYYVATAHGPDLYKNSQQAIRYIIDYLSSEHKMTREQAFCLCGAAVDLKISEIVDAPNWIVSAYLPLSIFK